MKIKYFYIRQRNQDHGRGDPIACIASLVDGDRICYALSVANPKDEFKKKLARVIAVNRLVSEKPLKFYREVQVKDLSRKNILRTMMQDVAHGGWVPRKIAKAAQQWLNSEEFFVPSVYMFSSAGVTSTYGASLDD